MDNTNVKTTLTFEDILDAKKRLDGHIERTPVLTCSEIDDRVGRQVFFKAENLQKTGSFKCRGAFNAVALKKEKGDFEHDSTCNGSGNPPTVVTISCGNHGTALAWACQHHCIPCKVFLPYDAESYRIENISKYGAEVVICKKEQIDDLNARTEFFNQAIYSGRPAHYRPITTSGNYGVMAGQGTVGLEFLDEVPDLDAILVTTGGGGLLTGVAVAVKNINPQIKVFAAEPLGKDLEKCLKTGERILPDPGIRVETVAEGVRKKALAPKCWDMCKSGLIETDVLSVTDEEIVEAMKLMFSKIKTVVEVTAGVGVAAVLSTKMKSLDPSIKKVGVILCGGNADLDNLPWNK